MSYRVRLLVVAATCAATSAMGQGAAASNRLASQRRADSVAVAKVVNDFSNALSSGDSSRALSLLASDAVILESGGVELRSEYRSHHLPEDINFAKAVASTRGPVQVRIAGTSAWTIRTSTAKGEFKSKPVDSMGAESMVLTKEPAGWRIRVIHWSSRSRAPSK